MLRRTGLDVFRTCRRSFAHVTWTCSKPRITNDGFNSWRTLNRGRYLGVYSRNTKSVSLYRSFCPSNFVPSRSIVCSTRVSNSSVESKALNIRPPLSLNIEDDQITISGDKGRSLKFHYIWLRDHCQCVKCLTPIVNQREIDIMKIPLDIKPVDVSLNENKLHLRWEDGHQTTYDLEWLNEHHFEKQIFNYSKGDERREIHLWDGSIKENLPPPVVFEKIMHNEKEVLNALEQLLKYGLVFVSGVPTTAMGTEDVISHLCERVMETFYGKVIVFTSNQEYADTAYSTLGIGGHVDTTYFTQSVGLQTLHCHFHDGSGGRSLFIDTFHAAEILREKNPDAFQILSTVPVHFQYLDDDRHFKALSPVIKLHPLSNSIVQVRYNNADRGVLDTVPQKDIPRFYKALKEFVSILHNPENEFWVQLKPGTLVIMDNWRVMHGRSEFTGTRVMCSCYVTRDDLLSKVRHLRHKLGS